MQPLILSLRIEPAAQAVLDGLRLRHFPPERNFLAAHVTLFHKLPGEEEAAIRETLQTRCAECPPLLLQLPGVRSLGRGVAVTVEGPALIQLRQRLAADWRAWLGAQDQQGYRPHVTIQNKVAPEVARELHAALAATWQPWSARGEGLLLWRYLGGPWELLAEFPFTTLDAECRQTAST